MGKRAAMLGTSRKKKKKIGDKRRVFFKNALEYLISDSYMFSLLTSPASFLGSKNNPSLTIREVDDVTEKGKKLTEKIKEYLKSDAYMYAPLCDPQYVTYHKGYASNLKRVNMGISMKKMVAKDNQLTMESSNITVENRIREGHLSQAWIEFLKKLPRKYVKRKINHNCRSSSVSGKGRQPQMMSF